MINPAKEEYLRDWIDMSCDYHFDVEPKELKGLWLFMLECELATIGEEL